MEWKYLWNEMKRHPVRQVSKVYNVSSIYNMNSKPIKNIATENQEYDKKTIFNI